MTSAPDIEHLEKVARAALVGSPQGWTAHRGDYDYDYCVDAEGSYLGGCPDCYTRASFDEEGANHIATFDPPTALALVAEVRELRARLSDVSSVAQSVDASAGGAVEYCHPETLVWRNVALDLFKALGEEA